ncbi:heat stress transcription factor B-2A, putative [Entamoeba invadens IP1]|uniref:Heat stress transcription factor B-2A, putative n=1 Tax=Entamoeba invadens IP1 TaxID=370355 RepID=A0A0A1UG99_ENTIV|nr:heat stress transcription factor B-2A, putative [Entamoeba invadens IP1]ELP92468.1 heat stress transcription factor B-2A, putative [Entamoeba invadens IP1]|eukprot:XP_004259239.1 heat stress transcription factor B-2A, putative [Entamoeba invadens IP1]
MEGRCLTEMIDTLDETSGEIGGVPSPKVTNGVVVPLEGLAVASDVISDATAEHLHNCAPFIAKLYSLVNTIEYKDMIGWSNTFKGYSICVKDPVQFAKEVLPKNFKHSNMASFVRQLNIYGFHKLESKDGVCFKHEFFQKDHPDYLQKIKRKKTKKNKSLSPHCQQEVNKDFTLESPIQTGFNGDNSLFNVMALKIDLGKVQNQVQEMRGEIVESRNKWTLLQRRMDQLDQMLNLLYSSYSNFSNLQIQNQNPSPQGNGYGQIPKFME